MSVATSLIPIVPYAERAERLRAIHDRVRHAGAIFLGSYSSEPVGDYFAGPNHVLPTGGTERYASALGVHDFVRWQSVIAYSERRLRATGERFARFADAEGLGGHALAVRTRMTDDE